MLWVREGGGKVLFTDSTVLSDYSAVTGFIPAPATDKSTMAEAAAYRQEKTGIVTTDCAQSWAICCARGRQSATSGLGLIFVFRGRDRGLGSAKRR